MWLGRFSSILLVLSLSSCSYRVSVPVDTLQPPTVYYVSPHANITVNYTYSESRRFKDPETVLTSQLDSIAAESAAYSFMGGFATPALGSHANVVTYCTVRPDSSPSSTFILPKDLVGSIVESTNAQQIISLDYFSLNPDITVVPDLQNQYGYRAYFTIKAVGLWRIYSPDSQTAQAEYLYQKSYSWDAAGSSRREAVDNLPKFEDVASYVGSEVGIASLAAFTPIWTTQYREIVTSTNSYLKMAQNKVNENNWAEAIKIWSWLVGSNSNNKLKGQAAYNLAVASEVDGNYNLAASWLDIADSLRPGSQYVAEYRAVLNDRLKAEAILDSLK
ncbi:MAG TPA: DUF6340 family protein [Williamwhitmania sp.]|nr:DUF6340 family protein [Williamwhitmania sp.]